MALAQRDANRTKPLPSGSGLAACAVYPSVTRIACPGCRAPLDSVSAVPEHIASGACPVFKSLPQWFIDTLPSSATTAAVSAPANTTTTPRRPGRDVGMMDDLASPCVRRLGAGSTAASPLPLASPTSPFLLRRRQHGSVDVAEPPFTTLVCDVCSTRGPWYPSAPAGSTVRQLSCAFACGHALCNGCVRGMFDTALQACNLDALLCPVAGCGTQHEFDDRDDEDDNDDNSSSSKAQARARRGRRRGQVSEHDTAGLVTAAEWERLHSGVMSRYVDEQLRAGRFIKCPTCAFVTELVTATETESSASAATAASATTALMIEGFAHAPDAAAAYRQHRMRCVQCNTTFCAQCFVTPFHLGMTCATHRRHLEGGTCRFCQSACSSACSSSSSSSSPSSNAAEPALAVLPRDVCSSAECVERGRSCCPATRACGHPCYFSRHQPHSDAEHPCLVADCPSRRRCCAVEGGAAAAAAASAQHDDASLPTRDDWCTICYTDTLAAGPVVRLASCTHVFHLDCVRQKIAARWPGPRITFGFLGCAVCKREMTTALGSKNKTDDNDDDNADVDSAEQPRLVASAPELQELLEPVLRMRHALRRTMIQRLKHEGMDQRPEVVSDSASPFYGKPELYAEHIFAFYPCYKCGEPFYGGMNRCADGLVGGDGNDADNNNNRRQLHNPKDLLCSKCIPDAQRRECSIHGAHFMTYKCKFCCNVAAYFCWNSTHFCAACHKTQEGGRYLNKLPLSELPVCPRHAGTGPCPLGVEHPPTGTAEFCWCSLCHA